MLTVYKYSIHAGNWWRPLWKILSRSWLWVAGSHVGKPTDGLSVFSYYKRVACKFNLCFWCFDKNEVGTNLIRVRVMYLFMCRRDTIHLWVKNTLGEIHAIQASRNASCGAVYKTVEQLTGIPQDLQMLSTGHAILNPKRALTDYNLSSGSWLHLSVKGVGGNGESGRWYSTECVWNTACLYSYYWIPHCSYNLFAIMTYIMHTGPGRDQWWMWFLWRRGRCVLCRMCFLSLQYM